ncbi:MAG: imidazole glycerol phosphate synthase subunit HisH, partial [Flavobacteriales bacterium CG_4_8_14_3_um_filter_35_10]
MIILKKKILIIDYKSGNLFSVNQALTNIGLNVFISSNANDILSADAIVLPGVGAFGDAMKNLHNLNLVKPIEQAVESGKPFLGICLGLQLLFTESEEFGYTKGLDLVKGKVRRFNINNIAGESRKIPQIAWNKINKINNNTWDNTPLQDIKDGEFMYFVHSFYVDPEEQVGLSETDYDGQIYVSSIQKNNIFACQFHPEKSAQKGLQIYKTWASIN